METREKLIERKSNYTLVIIDLVEENIEKAIERNDPEMVLALAELLKAIF